MPYRERIAQAKPQDEDKREHGETSFTVAMGLFVAVSLVRVAGGVAEHETFGAEASLALLVVLVGFTWAGHAAVRAAQSWRRARRHRAAGHTLDA